MRHTTSRYRNWASVLLAVMVSGMFCAAANADVSLLGVQYQEDDPLPEYHCFWHDSDYPTSCGAALVGANAHVFLKNDGASAVTLDDATLATYSLSYALMQKTMDTMIGNSVWFRYDNPPQDLLDAGEPAWYKMDPASIPAGGVGQVIVRLRRAPVTSTISIGVDTSANTLATTITVDADVPQLANIGFSQDLKKVYLTWRRSGGAAPTTVKMDGTDVTSITTTVGDSSTNFGVSVVSLSTALTELSYHVFQGIYSDSKTATGGIRVWINPFIYGSWAAFPIVDNAMAQDWIDMCFDRGINTFEMNSDNGLDNYLGTSGGKTYANDHNYSFIRNDEGWGTWGNNPRLWFIEDEPDIDEYYFQDYYCGTGYKLPCGTQQAGSMGMYYISVGEGLRSIKNRPTTINLDGTNKPESWYAYGQLADNLAIDHYFQPKVRHAYFDLTNTQPLYEKATVMYATAREGTRAAEPNPYRQLLYSCQINGGEAVDPWPFAPPECKRIEAYYSMAAGAKGICYWWWKKATGALSNGLGGDNLVSQNPALWKEVGLIGVEIKTLQPYLVTSHPVDLAVEGSTNVWVKGLARGTDTLILFAVNDDYWLDEDYHGTDVSNASVTVTLPSWMLSSPGAFEVSRTGISSVSTSQNGGELTLTLGTLSVAKILIVTTDPLLMMTIRQRYDTEVRPGICNFATTECNANTSAPSFVRQPSAQAVVSGGTATFSIAADGGGTLTYQWQKNSTNQSDGGHYAGCTTPVLTVSTVDTNDVTNYRCKITNTYGSATSNQAALSITTVNITQHPSPQNVCAGSNASFSVAATGQGTLYYQWQKDSTNQSNGGHYSGCTTATLTVTGADTNDAASYRCKVTDSSNTAYSNTAALSIKTATSISSHPSNQSVGSGGTATFTVVGAGYGTLTYQWQKNSANQSDGGHYSGCTTATLTVSPVDTNDTTNYRCIVTGGCGSATSNQASLTIDPCLPALGLDNGNFDTWPSGSVAPNWTSFQSGTSAYSKSTSIYHSSPNAQRLRPPISGAGAYCGVYQNVNANQGDAITFVAWTYNESPSSFITSRLGVQFDGSTSPPGSWQTNSSKQTWTSLTVAGNATHATNGVTVFAEAVLAQDGTYYVDVDDVVEYRAFVPPAPTVTAGGSTSLNVNVDPGCNSYNSSTEFAITIGGGAYTLGTHWVQANGTVSTSAVWQTDSTWGTKTVTGLATDTTYTFETKARYNSTYAQASNLGAGAQGTPQSSVTITQHPSAQNICPSANATFTVAATGSGTLTYQWQKNQVNQSNGGHYSGCTTATLTITGADTNDVANYRCKVTDSYDSVNSNEAALSLKTATSISSHPSNQAIALGGTTTFSVTATGDGTLTYQWQKNSVNQSDGGHYSGCTTATLTISTADTNDEADYCCKVTGGCGSATSNQASLTIDPCAPVLGLMNGNFDASTGSWTVAANWTSFQSASSAYSKSTSKYHSSPNAQRLRPHTTGAGAYCGVYQNVNAIQGDAITFVAWTYNESPLQFITSRLGVQFDGSTSPPGSWQTNSSNATWTSLTVAGIATHATNGVTVFAEAVLAQDGTYYVDVDDVVEYRAFVPPAPTVTAASSTSLNVNVDPGCNSYNSNTEFAITIGGGSYTLGTHWVQANGTVSTSAVWQTDSTWGTKTVTGLTTGVTYTFQVKARYNSTYTQASSLGASAQGTPQSTVTITQHPSAQNICPSANATFTVAATGSGTLTYQWQKNQVNQSNGGHYSGCTTATLAVTGADTNDVANYRCKVTDSYDSLNSNEAALSLKTATSISSHPSNQSVGSGGTATFSVTATGDSVTYQWQKNSVNQSNGGHYSGCTTATLTISTADTNDAANYRCIVTATCGSATSNQAALTICPSDLVNGNFDASTGSWTVAANWTSFQSASSAYSKSTSKYHSSPNAQRLRPHTTGAGAYCGVYQNVQATQGDAITFVGWTYNESPSQFITSRLGVQFDGSTSPPGSWQTNTSNATWTSLTVAGVATHATNGVTVFAEAVLAQDGTYYVDVDDVVEYHGHLPPTPAVAWASSTSLNVNVDPGCNSGNSSAEYAITISGGAYTEGTHWVQADGTVSTTTVWQTDSTWGTKTVTGLSTGTTYTFKVKARYSSSYTQATSLGAGATGTP